MKCAASILTPTHGRLAVMLLSASIFLAPHSALAQQDERVSDLMTEGWRNTALIDRVKPSDRAAELRFISAEELKANARFSALAQAAEMRLALPGTRAALMSENRLVVLEKYLAGKASASSTPVGNSISKSLVSLAVGKALCDGSIKSLDDRVDSYVERLAGSSWGNASVRDLLRMSSGAFRPEPSAGSGFKNLQDTQTNRLIYTQALRSDYIDMMKARDDKAATPGSEFNYNNYDTNALALIVEAATKKKFAKFFEDAIWRDVGSEKEGAWIKNSRGQISGYFGFSAAPRDWLRLGHYVLDELKKPGCFSDYLKEATEEQIPANWTFMKSYGYQIWTNCTRKPGSFCFLGFGGQQLIMHPTTDTVLYVHGTTNESAPPWRQLFERF